MVQLRRQAKASKLSPDPAREQKVPVGQLESPVVAQGSTH
jgi:hypothetical protein